MTSINDDPSSLNNQNEQSENKDCKMNIKFEA